MPLDKLVLILVSVIAAAGATLYFASLLVVGFDINPKLALALFVPLALVAYICVRVIAERVNNKEDDHYDTIER